VYRSVAFAVIVIMVTALAIGTAIAKDNPTDKQKVNGPERVTYVFKGTIAQNSEEGSSLKVNVEKGNKVARVFVRKQLEFAISSTTEIYLDDADAQHPGLEAQISKSRAG